MPADNEQITIRHEAVTRAEKADVTVRRDTRTEAERLWLVAGVIAFRTTFGFQVDEKSVCSLLVHGCNWTHGIGTPALAEDFAIWKQGGMAGNILNGEWLLPLPFLLVELISLILGFF
jgi:hypothetical protein